jgi:(E)-4-hydroxy-3-methylbut-2-enyl-diphosphate synthase
MDAEDMHFPLHLGVTEAGNGDDGRIKSAVGIGSLLADGLGDTIRVSLTEAPEKEIPVAKEIVRHFRLLPSAEAKATDSFNYLETNTARRNSTGNKAIVIADLSKRDCINISDIEKLGGDSKQERLQGNPLPDYIYTGYSTLMFDNEYPKIIDYCNDSFMFCKHSMFNIAFFDWLRENRDTTLVVSFDETESIAEQRSFFIELQENEIANPVIIARNYAEKNFDKLQVIAACDFGALLIDGFGDGIMLSAMPGISPKLVSDLCFRILQASRVKQTRTEYIACPGCGRTLFDLNETLKKIKKATSEFHSLKIAVMGCIVNGPGEMADADYGYVGAGPGKITLYKGKDAVKKNIPQQNAIEELIDLIKKN